MKPSPVLSAYLGKGLYSLSDAARLLREQRVTVERWAFGYGRRNQRYPPVIDTHVPDVAGRHGVTFLELVELFTIREFRKANTPWRKIRRTFDYAAKRFKTTFPFALQKWFADHAGIYYQDGEGEDASFEEMSGEGQLAMRAALLPYLRQLDFDLDGLAARWYPQGKDAPIVIDPAIAFGAPVIQGTGIQTATLAGMAEAGESSDSLAWWYGLTVVQVDAALKYERRLARARRVPVR